MVLLEVCIDNFESAKAAVAGGASRIELCSALSEGGLTPSVGFLIQVKQITDIPIFCMLRCRKGSDFVYSEQELNIMIEDAKILRQHGADGFVFGALKEDKDIDIKKCREVIKACFPLPVTFHRAFDVCKNPIIGLETLIDVGFKRVLTSGQMKSVKDGCPLIRQLIEKANRRITVMPGCGVNVDNLQEIIDTTHAREIHASARVPKAKKVDGDEQSVTMGSDESPYMVTDEDIVRDLIRVINNIEQ